MRSVWQWETQRLGIGAPALIATDNISIPMRNTTETASSNNLKSCLLAYETF